MPSFVSNWRQIGWRASNWAVTDLARENFTTLPARAANSTGPEAKLSAAVWQAGVISKKNKMTDHTRATARLASGALESVVGVGIEEI